MNIMLKPYSDEDELIWDNWCKKSFNATFLHTRAFLKYHPKSRFQDESLLFFHDENLVGVLPAARSPRDAKIVISHPGGTFGGIIHDGWIKGERMLILFEQIKQYYNKQDYEKLIYKPIPFIYSAIPAQDDLYALFRLQGSRKECNLSSTIDLSARRQPSSRRARSLKKALKMVKVVQGTIWLSALWDVICETLTRKYDTKPVHQLDELLFLIDQFPDDIQVYCALLNDKVAAGVILFNSTYVWHAQYIASSEIGNDVSALDAVFEAIISDAKNGEVRYFDFGTSNEKHGTILNDSLYCFKSEFGGGGMVYDSYEIELCK